MTSRAVLCIGSSDIMVTTEHEIKPGQTNMTGLHRHTVLYSILREGCSVEIDQMQATNPQWAVGGRGRTQFKQVGKVRTVGKV